MALPTLMDLETDVAAMVVVKDMSMAAMKMNSCLGVLVIIVLYY